MTVSDEMLLSHVESLLTTSKAKSFLGREFLTWLWYHAEKTDSPVSIKSPKRERPYFADLWIDDRLVLESQHTKAHVQTLKGGDPSRSIEAASALLTGKSVKEMRVGFNIDALGEFTFTLNGSDLSPRSIHLPDPSSELSQEDSFSLLSYRLKASQVLVDVLDGLFCQFIEERTDDEWQSRGMGDIKSWIQSRSQDQEHALH